ncbi:uncharacterized protein LOC128647124 [Bombina bombina]|uniref:uncharacterized protein LOC128647124 n=1 Tax=Bombina bombina TaxID=8345 RepID=UPI00235AB0D5|nr:uncharacterized protein LOC128647124 [Bombina bombina]
MLDVCVNIYLDDILIYLESLEQYIKHVTTVLTRLRENQLYAKPEKCIFHTQDISFLGYRITAEGINMEDTKITSITSWPQPTTVKELQSFLGFSNFYCKFIKNFSSIVKPLTRLTGKATAFVWTPEAQRAFESLKVSFTTAPILHFPDTTLQYILEVDASEYTIAAILSQ